jgi:hypothetical protein
MDPDEILKEIRERKQREAAEKSDIERAERTEEERKKRALFDRAVLISDKLKEIRQILERAKMPQGFSSKSESLPRGVQGKELVTRTCLIVFEYPPRPLRVDELKAPSKNFVLEAWENPEGGSVVFSFFDEAENSREVITECPPEQVDEIKIEEIFLRFVKWFGERFY